MRDYKKFKLLDIKSSCIDMIIASFALWLTSEYGFLFQDCLGLKIDNSQTTWGKKIYIDNSDLITVAIEANKLKISSIDISQISINKLLELLECYKPLVMQVDEYYCKWRKNYKKIHRFHYLLISGFNKEAKSFICIDTYPTMHNLIFSYDEILNYILRIFYIDKAEYHNRKECKNIKLLLTPTILKFTHKDENGTIFDRKLHLAKNISMNFNYKKEVEGFEDIDLVFIPIVWKLKNIVWSWYQFEYFINYINNPHINTLIKQIKEIQKLWEIITNIIIMRIVKKDNLYMSDNIMNKFNLIVLKEQDLMNKLTEYSK